MCKVIPKYLYHLTTKWNYEAIMQSGKLIAKNEDLAGNSIFMFELQNYLKRWKELKMPCINMSAKDALVKYTDKDGSGLVLLRIPTKNLNSEQLRVRSQERLFKESERLEKILEEKKLQYIRTQNKEVLAEVNKVREGLSDEKAAEMMTKMQNEYEKQFPYPQIEDVVKEQEMTSGMIGEAAKNRRLYEQRKEAIEYIYPEDISTSQIEKIGECDSNQPINNIFMTLLKGKPEEKALKNSV